VYFYFWNNKHVGRPRGRSPSPGRGDIFLFSTLSRPHLGPTQSANKWVPAALSPGVKRQGRVADHSTPTNAEVKSMWIYNYPLPHTPAWRSAQFVKHRDNFTLNAFYNRPIINGCSLKWDGIMSAHLKYRAYITSKYNKIKQRNFSIDLLVWVVCTCAGSKRNDPLCKPIRLSRCFNSRIAGGVYIKCGVDIVPLDAAPDRPSQFLAIGNTDLMKTQACEWERQFILKYPASLCVR
jgi:hypothetical protein